MLKKLFATISLCTVLGVTNTALALTGSQTTNIHYNDIKIMVDGKFVETSNEPFTLNGVTYVPLRDVGNSLNTTVHWEPSTKTVVINKKDVVNNNKATADNETETVKETTTGTNTNNNQPTKNVTKYKIPEYPDQTAEDLAFSNLLLQKYGMLDDVTLTSFMLMGDKREVTIDIYLDLENNLETWNALSDSEIDKWLEEITDDIQEKYDDDTLVEGDIIRLSNRDVLIDFDKDGKDSFKVRHYDSSYRSGIETRIVKLPFENSYSKNFTVNDINFKTSSAIYRENYNSLDIVLSSTKSGVVFNWNKAGTKETRQQVQSVCQQIIDDFENDSAIKLDQINISFKDKNKQIDFFRYNVAEEKFLK